MKLRLYLDCLGTGHFQSFWCDHHYYQHCRGKKRITVSAQGTTGTSQGETDTSRRKIPESGVTPKSTNSKPLCKESTGNVNTQYSKAYRHPCTSVLSTVRLPLLGRGKRKVNLQCSLGPRVPNQFPTKEFIR